MLREIIANNVLADTDGENGGNFGAVILEDEIIFIDTGMYHHKTTESKAYLSKHYKQPVTKVLITHYHSDHVLGTQALLPATVISTRQTRTLLNTALPSPEELKEWAKQNKNERPELWVAAQDYSPRLPDITFSRIIIIGTEQTIEMRHTGGHTDGSSIVILKDENVCFCGDLIFNGAFPFAGDATCDPDKWITALEEIHRAKYEIIVPGHGPVCNNATVQEHLEFFKELKKRILESIERGISVGEFINKGLIPEYHPDEDGHRTRGTLARWFQFYQKQLFQMDKE